MGCFDWLHFSDLHFKPNDKFNTLVARKNLIEYIGKNNIRCDYLFITGDIADKSNYSNAHDFISQLIEVLSVENSNVFWAVGNHDINRTRKHRNETIHEIRDEHDRNARFTKAMADDEERILLKRIGMQEYISEYKTMFGRTLSKKDIDNVHIVYKLPDVNIIVLNTCITSCDNEDEHNLMLFDISILDVLSEINKNNPTIAIGHHGYEFFYKKEQDNIIDVLNEKVDVYLCGHSHKLGYYYWSEAKNDIHQFTCGGVISDYSKITFMQGKYDETSRAITIVPHSYADDGDREWAIDYRLHRKLYDSKQFLLGRIDANRITQPHNTVDSDDNILTISEYESRIKQLVKLEGSSENTDILSRLTISKTSRMPNWAAFDILDKSKSSEVRNYKYVLYIDISGFKAINDYFSYYGGDKILRGFSWWLYEKICKDMHKFSWLPFHRGGDEFCFLGYEDGSQQVNDLKEIADFMEYVCQDLQQQFLRIYLPCHNDDNDVTFGNDKITEMEKRKGYMRCIFIGMKMRFGIGTSIEDAEAESRNKDTISTSRGVLDMLFLWGGDDVFNRPEFRYEYVSVKDSLLFCLSTPTANTSLSEEYADLIYEIYTSEYLPVNKNDIKPKYCFRDQNILFCLNHHSADYMQTRHVEQKIVENIRKRHPLGDNFKSLFKSYS